MESHIAKNEEAHNKHNEIEKSWSASAWQLSNFRIYKPHRAHCSFQPLQSANKKKNALLKTVLHLIAHKQRDKVQ